MYTCEYRELCGTIVCVCVCVCTHRPPASCAGAAAVRRRRRARRRAGAWRPRRSPAKPRTAPSVNEGMKLNHLSHHRRPSGQLSNENNLSTTYDLRRRIVKTKRSTSYDDTITISSKSLAQSSNARAREIHLYKQILTYYYVLLILKFIKKHMELQKQFSILYFIVNLNHQTQTKFTT